MPSNVRSLTHLTALACAAAIAGCAAAEPEPEPKGAVALELEATAAATREMLPPEALDVIDSTNRQLEASGIAEAAMQIGDRAPDFTLPDSQGQPVSLNALLADGPVVLTFYRGHW